jgi:hypothetical protein
MPVFEESVNHNEFSFGFLRTNFSNSKNLIGPTTIKGLPKTRVNGNLRMRLKLI